MTIREQIEAMELKTLCPEACCAVQGGSRVKKEEKCSYRTEFQRDRDRILHSKAFRRLKDKTQVFLVPQGDHYRTRLTHTLEVSQIARTMARGLRLNEDLTEAVALGHDLGHTPFGHTGEAVLNEICPHGFRHYLQSVRVVDVLENDGRGLNLTYEVKDGIACHTNGVAATQEGRLVRLADTIAYINHDIDDAIRAGVLSQEDLPRGPLEVLGQTKSQRITAMVSSIIDGGPGDVAMPEPVKQAHDQLRAFLFETVYTGSRAKTEEEKAKQLVERLYQYFYQFPQRMPEEYQTIWKRFDADRAVCDYIAGMTDSYAISRFSDLFIPKAFPLR